MTVKTYRINVRPQKLAESIARERFEVETRRETCKTVLGKVVGVSLFDVRQGWSVQVVAVGA